MSDSLLLKVFVPLGLFIIMFGLGSTLTRSELRAALSHRVGLSTGLFAQLVLLPAIGLVLAWLAPVSFEFKIGILVLACCPGGTTSNVFAHLAKGNLALSVSLTTISSLVSLITMPVTLALGVGLLSDEAVPFDMPQGQIIKSLLALTVVPVCLGMLFRHYRSALAVRLEHRISLFSSGFLAVLIAVIIVQERSVLTANIPTLAPLLILMSAATMLAGFGLARAFRTDHADAVTIGLEAGIQNAGLAIFIALVVLANETMTIPAAVYTLCMYFSGTFMIWLGRKSAPPKSG